MKGARFVYQALLDRANAGAHVGISYDRLCALVEAEREQYIREQAESNRQAQARRRIEQLKAAPNGITAYDGEAVVVGVHDVRRVYGEREYLVTLWRPGRGNKKEWVAESQICDPSGDVLNEWR